MNDEFFKYALDIIDNLTTDELEAGLREFGIECKRKISVFDDQDVDVLGQYGISWPPTNSRKFLEPDELAVNYAANDNSYALAA